jgi:hypothetical protein
MNPVLIRMLTAAVLLAVFFPAVLLAPAWLWALLVSAVIMVGAHEWARLSQFPGSLPVVYAALVGLIALGLSFLPAADAQRRSGGALRPGGGCSGSCWHRSGWRSAGRGVRSSFAPRSG